MSLLYIIIRNVSIYCILFFITKPCQDYTTGNRMKIAKHVQWTVNTAGAGEDYFLCYEFCKTLWVDSF